MTRAERYAYLQHLRAVAKRLGLPLRGDLEKAVVECCQRELAGWVRAHGRPVTLTDLLALVAASLELDIEEIHADSDLDDLLRRIPPDQEPVMARLRAELDDETDGLMLQRCARRSWERPYLAIINCRGWHAYRRYFSKWHEVVHLLLDGKQLRLAYRRTPVVRGREPEEVLVDRVAAILAFYPDIFDPAFLEELEATGHLMFDVVDRVRQRLAPEASRHATLLACVRRCSRPVYFVRCCLGYKREEERRLTDRQPHLFPVGLSRPLPKLRVREAAASPGVERVGIRIYPNMEIPETSTVATAFRDGRGGRHYGVEPLEAWRTSRSGPIGTGEINVEAIRFQDEVWALISFPSP